ncbi:Transposon Ty3-I Gag-Pol polyprotein, partial [Aduncisulcus paluster]
MPFGLRNAPNHFQYAMQCCLEPVLRGKCVVFVDDLLVYGTHETFIDNLRSTFECLKKFGLRLKPSKCKLGVEETDFLGVLVNKDGITVDPSRIEQLLEQPAPKNVKDVRSFMGSANFFRKFIPDFATITAPLTDLMAKDKEFIWDERCDEAHNKIKKHLTSSPLLCHVDYSLPLVLHTDASTIGLGGVLTQPSEGGDRVIKYISKKLT